MHPTNTVYNWLLNIQTFLLPSRCLLCGATADAEHGLCTGCRGDLPGLKDACIRCGTTLGFGQSICGPCLRKPPPHSTFLAPFRYAPPVDSLIRAFKYRGDLAAGRALGRLLADHLARSEAPRPQLIVPVPLHPARMRSRGYNQATELARVLARRLDLSWSDGVCRRVRDTAAQTGLTAAERRKNLRNAFTAGAGVQSCHIALLDDVVTTGSTTRELAKVLLRSGAGRVDIWACARADSR